MNKKNKKKRLQKRKAGKKKQRRKKRKTDPSSREGKLGQVPSLAAQLSSLASVFSCGQLEEDCSDCRPRERSTLGRVRENVR